MAVVQIGAMRVLVLQLFMAVLVRVPHARIHRSVVRVNVVPVIVAMRVRVDDRLVMVRMSVALVVPEPDRERHDRGCEQLQR